MKKLALLSVLLGSFILATGCATPAYSFEERQRLAKRTSDFEWSLLQEDIDHILLRYPPTRMSIWNVR